jgi:hypothetical protein
VLRNTSSADGINTLETSGTNCKTTGITTTLPTTTAHFVVCSPSHSYRLVEVLVLTMILTLTRTLGLTLTRTLTRTLILPLTLTMTLTFLVLGGAHA